MESMVTDTLQLDAIRAMSDSLMALKNQLTEIKYTLEKSNGDAFTVNNLWMMISAGLVFIMHLGFATLESGLTQAKNTTNILFKNTMIPAYRSINLHTIWL